MILPPTVYIAGKYRGPTHWAIENNIRRAEEAALEVWKAGAAAVCPHANTRYFQGELPDERWLLGDLAILGQCDAMLLIEGWQDSAGAKAEQQFAAGKGIPIFYGMEDLTDWIAER